MENNPILRIKENIENINNKSFNIYFFTIDSKGAPNGYVSYIYESALCLHKMGYNVNMLYQDTDFIGVESWLGEEYANIPHFNIEKDKVSITASDFLFIPEFYSNVMSQTTKLPCKKVVITQNFNYLNQAIPAGASWKNFGIKDCIVTTNRLDEQIKSIFPSIKTHKVEPFINENIFNKSNEPKKLVINVVTKDNTEINQIIKPFFWKYPMYSWVSFRELRNLPKSEFAKYLKESVFTIWYDRDTEFGYAPIEAIKCGSIVIGKVPENIPDWMLENGELKNNAIWFFDINDVHRLIAGGIESFINDNIPQELYKEMDKMADKYTYNDFKKNITEVYINTIFEERKKELESYISILENKINN